MESGLQSRELNQCWTIRKGHRNIRHSKKKVIIGGHSAVKLQENVIDSSCVLRRDVEHSRSYFPGIQR